ncbi:MAG: hypothetical protein SAL07_24225 [Oscillatoria sp. PMC 1051.18]|nr:hypothetical protein [Oscillatoria sp. PMC 1050.18]MEC5033018.1 hypothetical protein [Oscillatoria sp. PMC 1051.18]
MKLNLVDSCLEIELTLVEQLLAFKLDKVLQIPLTEITRVTTSAPETNWKQLRAPGTFFPGIIKAGTYYTDRGKEFWYVTKPTNERNYLTLELNSDAYQRIVLTIDDNEYWESTLSQLATV